MKSTLRTPVRYGLRFRSKMSLAREMLDELRPHLPAGCRVYVVFDSWYASAKLVRCCLRRGWQVIADLKSNRTLDGKSLRTHAQASRHQRYERITLRATAGERTYYTRIWQGRLKRIPSPVTVLQSRRHPRDHHPKYLLCTDPTLGPREILTLYAQRWGCEVDYLYAKTRLGLEDFRLRTVEGIAKYCAVVFLVLAFLQHRRVHGRYKTLSDALAAHRQWHQQTLLREVVRYTLRHGSAEPVLRRFLRKAA